MKITIVSTAYPLRGGIAQYVGILYKKLEQRGHHVNVLTFKRQYPKIFFPGKTQLEVSQDDSVKIPTEPILDSINPITWIQASRKIKQFNSDLIIFKYWMPFFAPCFGTICQQSKKNSGPRILYICDNVIPHEKRPGDIALTRFAFRNADFFIVQSQVVREELLSLFPNAHYKLIPHPVYDIFGKAIEKNVAQKTIGLSDTKVILFFGYVRAYKGLDLLLKAMPIILQKQKVKLLVVGEFYENENDYHQLAKELNISEHVQFYSEFVPNEKVSLFFSAADLVVLPYKSATQSGIVQVAYHLNKPCVVTDVGGLAEVVIDNRTGFVVESESPPAIAEAVIRFYSENKEREFSRNVSKVKRKYSWDNMITAIENFMS